MNAPMHDHVAAKDGGFLSFLKRTYWTGRQYNAMCMSRPRLQQEQEKRLRHLLDVARARSPYYRDKFRHVSAGCTDLTQFPVTTKAEMMANFDQVVTDPAVTRAGVEQFIADVRNVKTPFLGKYCVAHTSGSQGQPALIVQNQLVLDLLFAFQMTRGNPSFRGLKRFTQAARNLVFPTHLAVLISQQGFFPSAWVWQRLPPYMHRYIRFLFLPANDPDLVAKLNEFSPTVLTATPTTLDLLSLKIDQFHFPRLRHVTTWSETLTEPARRRIREAFRVPVMDNYAMGECMFLTNGCPTSSGAHVNVDQVILEVVDEQNRPVPPGQLGHKVLMTNLANTVQPFIRYEIGDRLVMATEPCTCGNHLPRIEKLLGRAADFFWVQTSTGFRPLTAYPFQHAFDYLRDVREWQAEQVERNRVVVRLEPIPGATPDLSTARNRLDERLAPTGLRPELDISIETVSRLTSDARTSKFRRMISRVGIPDDLDPSLKEIAGDFALFQA
jgi:phenylacetate-CoA ligase